MILLFYHSIKITRFRQEINSFKNKCINSKNIYCSKIQKQVAFLVLLLFFVSLFVWLDNKDHSQIMLEIWLSL